MAGPERPPVAAVGRPLLQGRQPVAGLWFPAEGHREAARGRRLLAAWRPGSSAWRFDEGDLLRYPAEVWLACDRLAGWPLLREGMGLCSAPLTEAERRRLSVADLWLVRGGKLLALHLAQARRLDPSNWLDLSGPALHDTYDCRAALPPQVILLPPVRTVREVLGVALPPRRGPAPLEGRSGRPEHQRGGQARSAAAGTTPPWAFQTWLQQTTYLSQLLRMFEEGRLEEALRHALPLGSVEGMSLTGLAPGVPVPRTGLSLTHHPRGATGAAGSLQVIPDLAERLRRLYWEAFNRLDREGRVEEAVFVLAELMQERRRALDYLEARQCFALAAELAQAWDFPAAEIVRLYCLAGDWSRAVAVARRDDAFARAMWQMDKNWPNAARRLRREWGESLVLQGDWLGAVKAVWPVQELQTQALYWLQVAEAAGGELGAQALVERAQLLPDTMDRHAEWLRALRDERALHGERAALAKALIAATSPGKATRALAAAMTGAVLADHALGQGWLGTDALQDLVKLGGNALLRADLPAAGWPQTRRQPLAQREGVLAGEAPEPGAHALLDVVPLADRRHLVALGEAGAMVVDAAGRPVTRFDVPAQRLVLARSRRQALALARRDGVWRVSRLDLVQQRASDLGVCELDHFADSFDGLGWAVARGARLQILDTGRSLQDVLWQPPDLPGPVQALGATFNAERVVADDSLWTFDLRKGRRPTCEALISVHVPLSRRLLNPQRGVVTVAVHTPSSGVPRVGWLGPGMTGKMLLPPGQEHEVQADTAGDWLVLVWQEAAAGQGEVWRMVRWIHLSDGATRATVRWPVGGVLRLRACGSQWLLFDDRGRLLRLDTASGEVLRLAAR